MHPFGKITPLGVEAFSIAVHPAIEKLYSLFFANFASLRFKLLFFNVEH